MIASVYIKNGNIHFYNEGETFSTIGGMEYTLGTPLLNFLCYEQDRFDDSFGIFASVFDGDYTYIGAREPEFLANLREDSGNMQQREVYVNFYHRMFFEFIYGFIEWPRMAIERLEEVLPGAREKLAWTVNFAWPEPAIGKIYADKERRLFRAAKGVVELMSEDFRHACEATTTEVELLLALRESDEVKVDSPMEYLYLLETIHMEESGYSHFVDKPFRAFYGCTKPPEIVELYEIDTIKDLIRFEFIKMIEHDIFIKKCKNCERFFIPKRRADAEYCERIFGENGRKCSEVGATLRYEKKVAGNPILDAHKKAYRRLNSRTRNGKMTQTEFVVWADEAARKRDACLAGELPFEEFVAWLEQGRVRKARG